jgi:glycosyltransferase involved in cell wall biosynthesis
MAAKNPVVAVKSSGIEDVIDEASNGYKTEEEIDKWSSRIKELLNDRKKYEEFSQNAFETAKNYSIEKMAEEAEELYYKIMQLKKYHND